MTGLLPFFVIVFAGLFFSDIFRKLHLPWVLSLIVAGIIIGPFGFGWFQPNETIEFLGEIGLVFLMFMAGLEVKLSSLKKYRQEILWLAIVNGMVPMIVGLWIGIMFELPVVAAVLLGIIFISSSVAVIIPTLESRGLIKTDLGKIIVGATIIEDTFSLLLLSFLLQSVNMRSNVPLPVFYVLLLASLWFMRWVIRHAKPKLSLSRFRLFKKKDDVYEHEFQKAFALLIGTVVVFELLGLHPIIAGFFAGLVMSEAIESDILKQKLHAISYGLFIPVFFVIVGTKTDLSVFFLSMHSLVIVLAVVLGSIFSKFISGMMGAIIDGFSFREGRFVGVATIPQLSTTLAVAFTGYELGIIGSELVTAMVMLSIVSTFLGPMLVSKLRVE